MQKIGNITTTADANGEWTNGNVAGGTPPTLLEAEWLNTVQRELVNIVTSGGLQPDPENDMQVLAALKVMFLQSGNLLSEIKNSGTAAQVEAQSNLGMTPRGVASFTASGSFTVPAGVYTIFVDACAGGGGGGGSAGNPGTANNAGGGTGGGAGQALLKSQYSVTPGQVINITIGSAGAGGNGGAAGANNGSSGVAGGNTIIGSLATLTGGGGGGGGLVSGGGGASTGFPSGGLGMDGIAFGGGGNGASSSFGGGGGSMRGVASAGGSNGQSAAGYGAGGSGGGAVYAAVSSKGGNGGNGTMGYAFIQW